MLWVRSPFTYWLVFGGTLAVPLTNGDASFSVQIISIVIVGLFVCVTSGILWTVLNAVMGIRVSEEDEINGLDTSELGMEALSRVLKRIIPDRMVKEVQIISIVIVCAVSPALSFLCHLNLGLGGRV